jgi:hypothetical protein
MNYNSKGAPLWKREEPMEGEVRRHAVDVGYRLVGRKLSLSFMRGILALEEAEEDWR